MKIILSLVLLIFSATYSFAQDDTTRIYLSQYAGVTTKDSAVTMVSLYRQGTLWHGKEYYSKTNLLKSEGDYEDNTILKRTGTFSNYSDKGILVNTTRYENGKPLERTYFYENGRKNSWISYEGDKVEQKGWDQVGNVIPDFIVEREAKFKGGADGWRRHLEKNLNANVAVDAGAPAGIYSVRLAFVVSKEGYPSNVKAVSVPAACKPCGAEGIKVINGSPQWEPAIQNDKNVNYQAIQVISFQVLEDTPKRRRGNRQ